MHELAAGSFAAWDETMRSILSGAGEADVPCADCTACCTSSQFIHIGPDETATLARIPKELVFPAPRMPKGHVVMGYDKHGHCPMLVDGSCSIYLDRPKTCRVYDCRIFAATGSPVGADRPAIAERVQRWRFEFPSTQDELLFAAAHNAAQFLLENASMLPTGAVPNNETQRAVAAFTIRDLFVDSDDDGNGHLVEPHLDAVVAALVRPDRSGAEAS